MSTYSYYSPAPKSRLVRRGPLRHASSQCRDAAYAQLSRRAWPLRPDAGRAARPGPHGQGHEILPAWSINIPNREYADDARNKIQIARDQLAGKEMDIGRYYLKRKNYRRDQPLRSGGQVSDHAPCRGGAGAADRGLYGHRHRRRGADRGRRARAQFSQSAMVQGRLQPSEGRRPGAEEHEDSWISKAFKKVGLS